jgi:hypothetical protein
VTQRSRCQSRSATNALAGFRTPVPRQMYSPPDQAGRQTQVERRWRHPGRLLKGFPHRLASTSLAWPNSLNAGYEAALQRSTRLNADARCAADHLSVKDWDRIDAQSVSNGNLNPRWPSNARAPPEPVASRRWLSSNGVNVGSRLPKLPSRRIQELPKTP